MAEQGSDGLPGPRRELPRPPRRVPSWAAEHDGGPSRATGPQTAIQPRPRMPVARRDGAAPGGPPKLRIRFLVPLIVFVLVLGAGAGWLVRAQSLSLDAGEVLDTVGPSLVQVLATTCDGTGQATGVLLPDGIVLTAASAIRKPVSVGLLTRDGKVRRADVLGVNPNGIAVLRMAGRRDKPTATLAPELPDPSADRALVSYQLSGEQAVAQAGTADEPRKLTEIVDGGALGAPLLDNRGRVIGLVTGDTVATGKVIGLEELRGFAGPDPALVPEPIGTCQARGPQSPVEPDLAVANTPLAGEVQRTLAEYLDTLNQHDFAAMQATYSDRVERLNTPGGDAKKHGTSYAFGAVITAVTATGGGSDADARMTFTVLFSPTSAGANGKTCGQLEILYHLVREQQRLRIDGAKTLANRPGCDTD
ncbi:hypothetical protein Kfla_4885 [Kribbella flavida DSM 17836]|uniref:Serine protease n=1 Tax=Kribbella flavida (strain DSM 17836 / JCM 10339 / NBRC 14399) TaxID=479435 RepID=D2Q0V1_KRIFD|nr:serine protease [Kribbella flavida]ADB33901.1 hypothetical protein Kfla_4885 [Kribbella flavida DSM 17836]